MINNKVSTENELKRMQALMNYGINESKQPEYSSVEYSKVAADGKLYGIVREGSNYYIKVAKDAKGGLVNENFDYIGGFRERKRNMFESFAKAQRNFNDKLIAINEDVDSSEKRILAETWDINAKQEISEARTKFMKNEIARQRQIMSNVCRINEGKAQCCDMPGCECAKQEKTEEIKSQPGAPFTTGLSNADLAKNEKGNLKGAKKKPVKGSTNESAEHPLSSRKNPDYMDTSHGTKIGKSAPFNNPVDGTENAVTNAEGGETESEETTTKVNEAEAMHKSQNQNSPAVGVGEIGDDAPFDEKATVTESLDDLDDDIEDDSDYDVEDVDAEDDEDIAAEDGIDDVDLEGDEDDDIEDNDVAPEDGEESFDIELDGDEEGDIESRMSSLEDKLDTILDAIQNMKYDDDEPLYDDEDSDDEDASDDDIDIEADGEEEDDEDVPEIAESRSYRRMRKLNEDRLNVFGKHPAYQKTVMTLPNPDMEDTDGKYDMNDKGSIPGNRPYGTRKGSSAPYTEPADQDVDAITESVLRIIKKKLGY
jgi:hypothetical protein